MPSLKPGGEAPIDAHGNGTLVGAMAGIPCMPTEVSFLKVKAEIHPVPLPVLIDFSLPAEFVQSKIIPALAPVTLRSLNWCCWWLRDFFFSPFTRRRMQITKRF